MDEVYLSGYTPYPTTPQDSRLPHVAERAERQIAKTALGAEKTVKWQLAADIFQLIRQLKKSGFQIVALEQTADAVNLATVKPAGNIALIVGSEVGGIEPELLQSTDRRIMLPMLGNKESFNVSVAAAVALYHLRWYNH